MSWMHLTTISLWQRCRNINTYGKISANNSYNPVTGQIVPAELNMHDFVHFDDAMERQSPQWNHWILWSHMHSDQNHVIKKYSKTLRLGKLLSLMIFSRALDAGSTMTVGPSTYSPMSCVQSHACSWMSMVVCLLKSNKYILFKYLGVFETEPVDPDILTVNLQQLLYHILWPYGATTTGSIASHQSCLNVYLSAKDDKRMRKSGSTTVECENNKHMLPNVLQIYFHTGKTISLS